MLQDDDTERNETRYITCSRKIQKEWTLTGHRGKCTRLFVPSVARRPRSLSSQMAHGPSIARSVIRRTDQAGVDEALIGHHGKCMRLFVPSVARRPRFPSNLMVQGPSTARNVISKTNRQGNKRRVLVRVFNHIFPFFSFLFSFLALML